MVNHLKESEALSTRNSFIEKHKSNKLTRFGYKFIGVLYFWLKTRILKRKVGHRNSIQGGTKRKTKVVTRDGKTKPMVLGWL